MTAVVWTTAALADLEAILDYVAERSFQGAATIADRVHQATRDISTFPRAARLDQGSGTYECVVRGVPLLIIYELVPNSGGVIRAEIIAVFHTSRDPTTKPKRRET
jgi:toxin ParE1/3/4